MCAKFRCADFTIGERERNSEVLAREFTVLLSLGIRIFVWEVEYFVSIKEKVNHHCSSN